MNKILLQRLHFKTDKTLFSYHGHFFRYTEVYLIYQLLCIVNVYILMNLDLSINCDTTTTNKVINLCITSKEPLLSLCSFFNGKNIWHEMPSKQVLSAQHSIVNYGAMLYRSLKLICIAKPYFYTR